jgi:thioredoxin-related protein
LAFLTILLLVSKSPATAQDSQEKGSFYTVADYGLDRDPAEDLKSTVERAQAEGKRILIQVGGEWCGWCKLLDAFIHDHEAIFARLEAGFLIMKVNYSRENYNRDFLGDYPDIPGYPHLYVLEKDGTLLYSKNTVELEEGRSYNEQAILDFLDEWMPKG